MKRKVAFGVVLILVNAVIGIISIGAYRDMNNRIFSLESYINNWDKYQASYPLSSFNERIALLESARKETIDKLLRALGVDSKYDFNNNLTRIWDLNKFFEHKAYAKTSVVLGVPGEVKESIPDSPEKLSKVGMTPAVVVGRYVLMASHTNDTEFFSQQVVRMRTPFGIVEQPFEFKVLEYKVTLLMPDGSEIALRELYRNKGKDFSLFEVYVSRAGSQENFEVLNFPFEIGKSNELKIGNFIYMNGWPRINSEVARPGFVTSLVSAIPDEALGVKKNNNEFSISQSTDQGDSGSPIMAFRDGRPELVGIYLGWIGVTGSNGINTRSRALKINVAVDEIKAKLGIDLRELQFQILHNNVGESR